eukprot:TRINITY_DN9834_c0_g1_i2.p2 TRINITY_DN9834_c0_g1~~TRINITY_DN9834_c0_g1_i2.p2  ORF type:complete len:219 (+),score=57.70 TRINITY_DN9834_c0_g1_i2:36-659(+)
MRNAPRPAWDRLSPPPPPAAKRRPLAAVQPSVFISPPVAGPALGCGAAELRPPLFAPPPQRSGSWLDPPLRSGSWFDGASLSPRRPTPDEITIEVPDEGLPAPDAPPRQPPVQPPAVVGRRPSASVFRPVGGGMTSPPPPRRYPAPPPPPPLSRVRARDRRSVSGSAQSECLEPETDEPPRAPTCVGSATPGRCRFIVLARTRRRRC